MVKVDKGILSWLTTVPAGDINFKGKVKEANELTLKEALKDKNLSKAAIKSIEIQLRKIKKMEAKK